MAGLREAFNLDVTQTTPKTTTMHNFSSLPDHVIKRVMQRCSSLSDVVSLSKTNTSCQATWEKHTDNILTWVVPRAFPSYYMALRALRASKLVHEAVAVSQMPPVITPNDQRLCNETIDRPEYEQLMDLRHLVDYVLERVFDKYCKMVPYGCGADYQSLPSFRSDTPLVRAWRLRIYQTTYRLLLMGAVLAHDVNIPFLHEEAPEIFQESFTLEWDNELGWEDQTPPDLGMLEVNYLLNWALYRLDYEACKRYTAVGPWAPWFAKSIEEDFRSRRTSGPRSAVDDVGPSDELTAQLIVHDTLQYMVANSNGSNRHGRPALPTPQHQSFKDSRRDCRAVPVVLLGIFQPEMLYLPLAVRPRNRRSWLKRKAPDDEETEIKCLVAEPIAPQGCCSRPRVPHTTSPFCARRKPVDIMQVAAKQLDFEAAYSGNPRTANSETFIDRIRYMAMGDPSYMDHGGIAFDRLTAFYRLNMV